VTTRIKVKATFVVDLEADHWNLPPVFFERFQEFIAHGLHGTGMVPAAIVSGNVTSEILNWEEKTAAARKKHPLKKGQGAIGPMIGASSSWAPPKPPRRKRVKDATG
jgi:hypothetical protein